MPEPVAGAAHAGGARRFAAGRERPANHAEPYVLDPAALPEHVDTLYRAAWAMCGSRFDAEDLVQETLCKVLKRPRLLRGDNEIGYLLRALKNTRASLYRTAARRPVTRQLREDDAPCPREDRFEAREIMEAIASVPAPLRDAVIAVDLLGLTYREAARSLRTREATITTRLYRGRQHVASALLNDTKAPPEPRARQRRARTAAPPMPASRQNS
jgi:RNA polymerase sigma-70 factor (ECF subfamily)